VVQAGAALGVADGEFDDGVATVVGVEFGHGAGPVGDPRVVVPGRKQLALVGVVAHATHDEPVAAERGLGGLLDPEPLGQGRGQQQPRVGDRALAPQVSVPTPWCTENRPPGS
jgi:hypothetical protein